MRLDSISPKLIGAYKLNYYKNNQPKKMFSLKTHACFRFIYVLSGSVTIQINSKKHIAKNGSIIYMPPYTRYRFTEKTDNLSLVNVFFNMSESESLSKDVLFYVDNNFKAPSNLTCFDENILNDYIIEDKKDLESAILKLTKRLDKQNQAFIEKSTLLYLISSLLTSDDNKRQTVADKVIEFIKNNVENGVTSQVLADKFSYHKNYLSSLIKNQTGLSLGEFIIKEKITRAKTLILDGELSLIEISNRLGFYDYSHFYKAFKKHLQISPTHFAK